MAPTADTQTENKFKSVETESEQQLEGRKGLDREREGRGEYREQLRSRSRSYSPKGRRHRSRSYERERRHRYRCVVWLCSAIYLSSYLCVRILIDQVLIDISTLLYTPLTHTPTSRGGEDTTESPLVSPDPTDLWRRDTTTRDLWTLPNTKNIMIQVSDIVRDLFN